MTRLLGTILRHNGEQHNGGTTVVHRRKSIHWLIKLQLSHQANAFHPLMHTNTRRVALWKKETSSHVNLWTTTSTAYHEQPGHDFWTCYLVFYMNSTWIKGRTTAPTSRPGNGARSYAEQQKHGQDRSTHHSKQSVETQRLRSRFSLLELLPVSTTATAAAS